MGGRHSSAIGASHYKKDELGESTIRKSGESPLLRAVLTATSLAAGALNGLLPMRHSAASIRGLGRTKT